MGTGRFRISLMGVKDINLILLALLFLLFLPLHSLADNAPITKIDSTVACPGTTFISHITVTNFTNIGSVTLRIEYDSTVLTFNPPPATSFNPVLAGATISSSPVSGTTRKIMIAWASTMGASLPNGSVLVNISFTYHTGSSILFFNNDSNGGADCEYANTQGIPLNDLPTATYYKNGLVSSGLPAQPSPVSGPISPCQGATANYSVTAVTGVSYAWSLPAGWTLNSGQGSSSVSCTAGNTGGNISVLPSNSCGNGPARTLLVSPLPLPSAPGPVGGPQSPCQGTPGLAYSISPVSNATGYTWTVPSTWAITSGQNTPSLVATAGTVGGNISVYASNSCGNSAISVLAVSPAQPPAANAGPNQTLGYGSPASLNGSASGGSGIYTWHWEPATLLINPNIQNPVSVNLTSSVQFTLTVTDAVSSCTGTSQVLITISGGPLSLSVSAMPNPSCEGDPVQLLALPSGGTGNYVFTWSSDPPGFTSYLQNPVASPLVSTTYIVNVYDGFASLTDSVHVNVLPLPSKPSKPTGPDTVDLKYTSSSTYTIPTVPSASSYAWDLLPVDAGTITGNGTSATVNWDQGFIGTAHIRVKTLNSCGESSWSDDKLTVVDKTTRIRELLQGNAMEIFPNPSRGMAMIRFSGSLPEGSNLEIIDMEGRRRMMLTGLESWPARGREIDLSSLQGGIFFAVLHAGNDILVRKIVVL